MTIARHFDLYLADLRQQLAALGDEVGAILTLANEGMKRPRVGLKAEAAAIEDRIDSRETAITTRCHELLVLQQDELALLRIHVGKAGLLLRC